ncbi:protein ORF8 [Lake sturgeon herpesvirus]|nr:protein ORF8 [Lake sturgeon herpesvirus]
MELSPALFSPSLYSPGVFKFDSHHIQCLAKKQFKNKNKAKKKKTHRLLQKVISDFTTTIKNNNQTYLKIVRDNSRILSQYKLLLSKHQRLCKIQQVQLKQLKKVKKQLCLVSAPGAGQVASCQLPTTCLSFSRPELVSAASAATELSTLELPKDKDEKKEETATAELNPTKVFDLSLTEALDLIIKPVSIEEIQVIQELEQKQIQPPEESQPQQQPPQQIPPLPELSELSLDLLLDTVPFTTINLDQLLNEGFLSVNAIYPVSSPPFVSFPITTPPPLSPALPALPNFFGPFNCLSPSLRDTLFYHDQ